MHAVASFLFRVVAVAAALLFAASLIVVMALLAAIWGVRALWARLTGRAFSPFEMRLDPRTGFRYVYRRGSSRQGGFAHAAAGGGGMAPSARPVFPRRADVTDVEPKA